MSSSSTTTTTTTESSKALYIASATASGREGRAVTSDGRLDVTLAAPTELGGSGEGTNPEQLFATGYAACFASALGLVARKHRVADFDVSVTADVSLRAAPARASPSGSCSMSSSRRGSTGHSASSSSRPRTGVPLLQRDAGQHPRRDCDRLSQGLRIDRAPAREDGRADSARSIKEID